MGICKIVVLVISVILVMADSCRCELCDQHSKQQDMSAVVMGPVNDKSLNTQN